MAAEEMAAEGIATEKLQLICLKFDNGTKPETLPEEYLFLFFTLASLKRVMICMSKTRCFAKCFKYETNNEIQEIVKAIVDAIQDYYGATDGYNAYRFIKAVAPIPPIYAQNLTRDLLSTDLTIGEIFAYFKEFPDYMLDKSLLYVLFFRRKLTSLEEPDAQIDSDEIMMIFDTIHKQESINQEDKKRYFALCVAVIHIFEKDIRKIPHFAEYSKMIETEF